MKIVKSVWRVICYPLLYVGLQFLLFFICSVVIGARVAMDAASQGGAAATPEDIMNAMSQLNTTLLLLFSNAATIALMALFMRKEWREESFLKPPAKELAAPILLCAAVGVSFSLLSDGAVYFSKLSELFPGYQGIITKILGKSFITEIVVVGLLAPICEEFVFRGAVLGRLRKYSVKLPLALIIQALLFALVHMNIVQGAATFVLGVLLGVLVVWSKTIWAPIVTHITYNSISVIMVHALGDTDIPDGVFAGITIAALAVTVVIIAALRRKLDVSKA